MADLADYQVQEKENSNRATELFNLMFPNLEKEIVFEVINIVSYLQGTKVNPAILPRVIRGVHNLMIGTGKGQVIVHVQGPMTNVSVKETDEEVKTRL